MAAQLVARQAHRASHHRTEHAQELLAAKEDRRAAERRQVDVGEHGPSERVRHLLKDHLVGVGAVGEGVGDIVGDGIGEGVGNGVGEGVGETVGVG